VLSITCLVAAIRPFAQPATLPLRVFGIDPGQFFRAGSATPAGTAVGLTFDYSRLTQIPQAPRADLLSLHIALRLLTLNSTGPGPVSRIGLLLADRFVPRPTVLGMMFDIGFQSGVSDPTFNAVPREGCAIFLDAILALRGPGPAYDQEVAFTAVHEVGHVFNLWHVLSPPNLMAQSPLGAPFGAGALFFLPPHAQFLSFAEQSNFVAPGGSDWGKRGTLGPAGDNPFNVAVNPSSRVKLHIRASHQECWAFEPVELEIRVSADRSVTLPDIIDPGYDDFSIWIEKPDGSRRAYKPTALYCSNSGTLSIAPQRPFSRDISIWGESGGYTFRDAGVHKITCVLRLGRRLVHSNTVELDVKQASRHSRYALAKDLLTDPDAARLLFYKTGRHPLRKVEPLTEAMRAFRGTPTAANIRYGLARALVTAAEHAPRSPRRRRYQVTAERALKSALDSGCFGRARQRRAEEWLERSILLR